MALRMQRHGGAVRWRGGRLVGPLVGRRAFTLVELAFTVLVTGLLIGIVIVGLRGAAVFARDQAEAVSVRSLGVSLRQFESQFGFVPPLVHDGGPMASPVPERADGSLFPETPVDRTDFDNPVVASYSGRYGDLFLRGYDPTNQTRYEFNTSTGVHPGADERYSKFSLAFYLVGALGADVDGVEGPGFNTPLRTPLRDGSFRSGAGAVAFESFFNAGQSTAATLEGEYFDAAEYGESGRVAAAPMGTAIAAAVSRDFQALVDRNGKAFRYYRWTQGDPLAGRGQPEIASVVDLNIPSVLLNVEDAVAAYNEAQGGGDVVTDITGGRADLREASWAIVGAGANGVFGTEEIAEIRSALGLVADFDELAARQLARDDNIVELGG